jgi:hypothetical protein
VIYPTFSEIETRVRRELDLIDEPSVTQSELISYCNQAIDVAESEIHSLYEDYFLKKASISLVSGQKEYALPSDIYAAKIRAIIYNVNNQIYEVMRMVDKRMFEKIIRTENYSSNQPYRYILLNDSASSGIKLYLFPTPQETTTNALTVWYLRNANRIVNPSDVIDIPEFSNFVVAKIKWLIAINKPGIMDAQSAAMDVQTQLTLMQESLQNRTPDDWTQVVMDMDAYEEHT